MLPSPFALSSLAFPPVFANVVIEVFDKGGPIMWPLLFCFVAALLVLLERAFWWAAIARRENSPRLNAVLGRVAAGDAAGAAALCDASPADPFLRVVRAGIAHRAGQFLGAMQIEAADLLDTAGKRLWVLSTLITLAPLLGLLGTVIGIMLSFNTVGSAELAIAEVKGGIAEALIATASGLVVAILCLLPHNYFNRRLARLRHALERTINRVEVLMVESKIAG